MLGRAQRGPRPIGRGGSRGRAPYVSKTTQMTEADIIDLARSSMLVMVKVAAAPLLAGLAIGLAVSIFQALTQIQEMTLTFVPKLVVMFASLILLMPFMSRTIGDYTTELNRRIIAVGHSNE